MLTHKIYYQLKPLIPRSLQLFLRRIIARRRLKLYKNVWPIDERAARAPEGWSGWPEGKKFALVLTHDVETYDGMIKCRKLAELEMALGFRSSFNFVAEDYPLDEALKSFLVNNGFEIGIHGLNHRGNIFSPPRRFLNEASRINYYLRKWGAVGFRAPSMYRDFDLLHFLDILYDSSGFDTDPFEPQPDGVGTIFPFLVPRRNKINQMDPKTATPQHSTTVAPQHSTTVAPQHRTTTALDSYFIELPYTLPQDHTLFLILKEKDCRIWKEKLDWIARKGGMALLLTHTDYMSFNGSGSKINYPVDYYIKFLEYIKSNYSEAYWHKLPYEVAHFYKNFILSHNL